MLKTQDNFFTSLLNCIKRTKEQRLFEEKLYNMGLENEQKLLIEKLNANISSKDIAIKFVLQELDVASTGDASLQHFVKKSGFYASEYIDAVKKFEGEQEEIEKIQLPFLDFLNKISNQQRMYEVVINTLNGVMKHWEIGKYSDERKMELVEDSLEEMPGVDFEEDSSFSLSMKAFKSAVMKKLIIADDKIQEVLDSFSAAKAEKSVNDEWLKEETSKEEKPQAIEKSMKIYSDEYVNELMEKYSEVIPLIITGKDSQEDAEAIQTFQSEMSLASFEGHSLAQVFCAFFEIQSSVALSQMDDAGKRFFIKILNAFDEEGFSENLEQYLEKNRDEVYALAKQGDKFMQYLVAFWYVFENEDKTKIEEEEYFWYHESASNGFEAAIKKLEAYTLEESEE